MKKIMIALLALATPFFVHAQIELDTDYYPSYVGQTSAILSGDIEVTDEDTVEIFFHYGFAGGVLDMTTESVFMIYPVEESEILIPIYGLIPDTDYEYTICAVASDGFPGMVCGITQDFDTDEEETDHPWVYTSYGTAESSTAVTVTAAGSDFGGYGSATVFVKYGQDPTFLDLTTESIIVEEPYEDFEFDLANLQPERLYYFQSCATNPSGTYCDIGIESFNTRSKGVIDLEIESFEQVGTCSFEIQFESDGMGDRPNPSNGTLKVGNPTGTSFYTQEFTFYDDNEHAIVIDYYPLVLAGIDLDDYMTVIQVKVEAGDAVGKVTGKYLFEGGECEDEVGFMDEGTVERISSSVSIKVYPNPAVGKVTIQNDESGELNLFDVTGRFVKSYEVDAGFTEIYLDFLSAGAYFFEFTNSEGKKITEKIIKQ